MKDLRKLSDKELKEMGDFASSASIINNFGSFLNNTKDGKEKESWRALVLLTTDFINTVAKGKVATVNSGVASGAVVEKLWLDINDFNTKALPKDFIKRNGTSDIWEVKDNKGNILYTAIKDNNDLTITSTHSPNDKATLKDFFTTATKRGNTYSANLWA